MTTKLLKTTQHADLVTIAYIEVSEKNVFENAVCLSRLFHIFANIIDQCKCRGVGAV